MSPSGRNPPDAHHCANEMVTFCLHRASRCCVALTRFFLFFAHVLLFLFSSRRETLYTCAEEQWSTCEGDAQKKMARLAAAAAWGLGKWASMDEYTCMIPREHYDGSLYRAVIAIHQNHYMQAQEVIIGVFVSYSRSKKRGTNGTRVWRRRY